MPRHQHSESFAFVLNDDDDSSTPLFSYSFTFPLDASFDECFLFLVDRFAVSCHHHEALRCQLKSFIDVQVSKIQQESYNRLVDKLRNKNVDLNDLCAKFDSAYRSSSEVYATAHRTHAEDAFADIYNKVVHSLTAPSLMQAELFYSRQLGLELDKRQRQLGSMDNLQNALTARLLNTFTINDVTDRVNQLQQRYSRLRQSVEVNWDSCLSDLKRRQRQKLRQLVEELATVLASVDDVPIHSPSPAFCKSPDKRSLLESATSNLVSEDHLRVEGYESPGNDFDLVALFGPMCDILPPEVSSYLSVISSSGHVMSSSGSVVDIIPNHNHFSPISSPPPPLPWVQTFSILLGKQLRQSCTLRVIRSFAVDLLMQSSAKSSTGDDELSDIAQRMGGAIGLYSNNLAGLVLVADKAVDTLNLNKRSFVDACERSVEYHFSDLGLQLTSIREILGRLNRLPERACHQQQRRDETPNQFAQIGDIFITRHSNLTDGEFGGVAGGGGGINVVFHPVLASSSDGSAIQSALGAILRTCYDYDITTLSIPLLMVDSIKEYMTKEWRTDRVVMIFKAFKNTMLEHYNLRKPFIPHTIQFIAHPTITDEELGKLGDLVNSSFSTDLQ